MPFDGFLNSCTEGSACRRRPLALPPFTFTDESGSTARTYDNFGNIKSEVRVIGGKTYTTSYSYDLANRLTEIIYPSGRYVDYTYDSSGYLTTVTTKPTSGGTVTTLASSITHKPFGPIASFTYGNSRAV